MESIKRNKHALHFLRKVKAVVLPKKKVLEVIIMDVRAALSHLDPATMQRINRWMAEVEIKILSKDERRYFDEYLAFRKDIKLSAARLNRYLDSCRIFLVFKNGELIASSSLDFQQHELEGGFELLLHFKKNDAYLFNVLVHPDYRRLGLAALLRYITLDYCRQNGYDFQYTLVYDWNQPNLNFHFRHGDILHGRITMVEHFAFKQHYFKTMNEKRDWKIQLKNGKTVTL